MSCLDDDDTIDAATADVLIEKVPDVANLTLASTFLGQFLSDRPFSVALALTGVGVWTALAVLAFVVAGND